jgi:signal transduction histidine kinase
VEPVSLKGNLYEEKSRILNIFSQIAGNLSKSSVRDFPTLQETISAEQSDVLQKVLDFTRELLNADKCALFLIDTSGKSLVLEKISGTVDFKKLKDIATYDLTKSIESNTGVTPWVLLSKKPFNARNFHELKNNSEGHWKGNWDAPMYGGQDEAKSKFQCLYMVPLLAGEDAIGVLKYENRTKGNHFFDEQDEQLINMIAALVTNLVISQRIERNRYDRILPIISSTLVTHFDKPTFYDELLEKCRLILSADFCSLFLLDDQKNLFLKSIAGVDAEKKNKLKNFGYGDYRITAGLTPWILIRGASFNVRSYPDLKGRSGSHHIGKWDDIVYDGRPEENFRSLYSVPLIIGNEHIGVFKVENKNIPPYYFTESDERLFDLIGRLIAVAVRYGRSRENERYLSQLSRTNELGYLASGISHEFNKYLNLFQFSAYNVLAFSESKKVNDQIELIIKDIENAEKLVEDFINIRNQIQNTIDFDLDAVIKRIVTISKQRFIMNNIELVYKNNGVKLLHLNPTDIQTIIINLINNAFESLIEIGKGGEIKIIIYPLENTTEFTIEVIDSGKGISQSEQETIFAPFFTTKPRGMGFGLFWVRRLVNTMNGSIKVESPNKYKGTTFIITLPIYVES